MQQTHDLATVLPQVSVLVRVLVLLDVGQTGLFVELHIGLVFLVVCAWYLMLGTWYCCCVAKGVVCVQLFFTRSQLIVDFCFFLQDRRLKAPSSLARKLNTTCTPDVIVLGAARSHTSSTREYVSR